MQETSPAAPVRIDKWLWAVRLYKTRGLATEACKAGHVKIHGETVKPSREIRGGETLTLKMETINRSVKVLLPLARRVGAKFVPLYLEDQTPASEYLKQIERCRKSPIGLRPKGAGRPTKKERRDLEDLF